MAFGREGGGEIDSGGCLSNPAFLVGNRDYPGQAASAPVLPVQNVANEVLLSSKLFHVKQLFSTVSYCNWKAIHELQVSSI